MTENLELKTQLNIDIPRYIDQINALKNSNHEQMQKENMKKMENEVKASKLEIDRLTGELNDLNEQLLSKSQNEAILNLQSNNLNKSIENLNRQLIDLKSEFDQINKLNDQLKESNNSLNKELKLKISKMTASINQQNSDLTK